MKIVFRLNFHTVFGQSLWLKLATIMDGTDLRIEQVLPMGWRNGTQWELVHELGASSRLRLEYSYQLREEGNGVRLDEWGGPRVVAVDPREQEVALLKDTWCSAGTPDYALETKAFRMAEREFADPGAAAGANHEFRLKMAGVPDGLVPCLLGSVREIGDWHWHNALPMVEVSENEWRAWTRLPADWRIEYKYGLFDPGKGCVTSLELGENRVLEERNLADAQWTRVCDECYRRGADQLPRAAGVAIPVFSLRGAGSHGVGEFADLMPLADWAAETGFQMIQILPINDTTSSHDWTDSYPYSAVSTIALHPIYLRISDLEYRMPTGFARELAAERKRLNALAEVDYEAVMASKTRLLRKVFASHGKKIAKSDGYRGFLEQNREWVLPYAVFCVKRDEFGTADFRKWGDWAAFDRESVEALAHDDTVSYHIWLQFELDRQLAASVAHLHDKGVALKGDLPIGIDRESVDAWCSPHLFKMHAQAGAPPDAFAVKGQNWGFPTYNWEEMAKDGFAWWQSRFARLSRYFDAYRIDHILGFFRIWQIPESQVEGIMGWFDPANPVHVNEFAQRGIAFDYDRFCRPWIREHQLAERFGGSCGEVRDTFLDDLGDGVYQLKRHVGTQRAIVEHFAGMEPSEHRDWLRQALLDCASDVLCFEVPGSDGKQYHLRCSMQSTRSFLDLDEGVRWRMEELYVDYFFRRQDAFWQACAYEKLPVMRRASEMLLCGEDLGMVPDCVPGVLKELGILSLEIQRMPKRSEVEFSDPAAAPYLSVVSPSTHDMPSLRGWWLEDPGAVGHFAQTMLGLHDAGRELSGDLATRIVYQHLASPAMWAVFPLQDLLAMDERLRAEDPASERINVPAIHPHYWRYRMHLSLDDLAAAADWNRRLGQMLQSSHRLSRK